MKQTPKTFKYGSWNGFLVATCSFEGSSRPAMMITCPRCSSRRAQRINSADFLLLLWDRGDPRRAKRNDLKNWQIFARAGMGTRRAPRTAAPPATAAGISPKGATVSFCVLAMSFQVDRHQSPVGSSYQWVAATISGIRIMTLIIEYMLYVMYGVFILCDCGDRWSSGDQEALHWIVNVRERL